MKYTWSEFKSHAEVDHGLRYGTTTVLELEDDEFITGLEGYSTELYVTQLTFVTNKSLFSPPLILQSGKPEELTPRPI